VERWEGGKVIRWKGGKGKRKFRELRMENEKRISVYSVNSVVYYKTAWIPACAGTTEVKDES